LNSLFTGRDEIRQKLQDCLPPDRYTRPREQQRFVLFGLGGGGKTQLALRFANDFKERYDRSS
jgi:Holliday junction resolvasome RuvABC ATP-dependent DNA helicase subunit